MKVLQKPGWETIPPSEGSGNGRLQPADRNHAMPNFPRVTMTIWTRKVEGHGKALPDVAGSDSGVALDTFRSTCSFLYFQSFLRSEYSFHSRH